MFEFTYVVFFANGEIKSFSDEDWTISTKLPSLRDSSTGEKKISTSAELTYASRNDESTPIKAVVLSYFLGRSVTFTPGNPKKFSFAQSGGISHGITVFYLKNPFKDQKSEMKSLFFPGDNWNQKNIDGWSLRSVHNKYYIRKNAIRNVSKIESDTELIFILYPKGPMDMGVKWKTIKTDEIINITPKKISPELRYLHVIYFDSRHATY